MTIGGTGLEDQCWEETRRDGKKETSQTDEGGGGDRDLLEVVPNPASSSRHGYVPSRRFMRLALLHKITLEEDSAGGLQAALEKTDSQTRLQDQWMDGWTHGRLAEARAGIHGLDTEWAPRSVSSPLAVATEHGKWLGLKPLGVWAAPSCWLVASKASKGGKRVSLDANGGRQGSALHSSRVSTGSRRPGIATRACSRARQFDLEDRGQYLQ